MLVAAVVLIIALALVFDFLNGFHDAANSIATVVSTRVLAPTYAVAWAAFFNFIAAFFGGVKVANTMGKGIMDFDLLKAQGPTSVLVVVFSALMGAIVWNILTWYWGLPSSSSHALTGGLIGASVLALGFKGLVGSGIFKIALFIVVAPVLGLVLGSTVMILTTWVVYLLKVTPLRADKWFRRLQLVSSGFYSFGHGSNDAQKVMGIIAVVLFGTIWKGQPFHVQWWMILSCHAAIALGTFFGGWRIVRTMGHSLTKLQPIGGFAAETGGGMTLLVSAALGIPVSTTHTITGAIVGVGSTRGYRAVHWGVAGRIVWAWIFTIPAAGLVAALFYLLARAVVFAVS
ncbi:MAG: inorganic phosphate transporter [Myxococcaceae bacterium]